MKVCLIQPAYSTDYTKIDEYFDAELALLAACDESMDLIVLPEYSDVLADVHGKEGVYGAFEKYNATLLTRS